MCGLTLVISKYQNGFNQQQQSIFNTLLYLSGGFRGRDGAGVFVVDNIGNVQMAKEGSSVDAFLATKEHGDLEKTAWERGWAMVGHNRAATRGVVSDKNSHPFIVDNKIVLVHNGTFYGDHKKHKDTEVDSEVFAHALSENSNVEVVLKEFNAAYALIWYNVEKKQINLIRNADRPLWWIETDGCYIYSSEEIFLEFVIKKYTLKPVDPPQLLNEYTLNTFTLLNDKKTDETIQKLNLTPKKVHYWSGVDYQSYYENKNRVLLEVTDSSQQDKVITTVGNNLVKTTFLEWEELRAEYNNTKRIRVVVDDLVEADDNPKTKNFILMGKTMDKNRMNAAFIIQDHTLENVIELTSKAVFEVDYVSMSWRRKDELFPVDVGMEQSKWPGVALLLANNPKPVYVNE